MFSDLKERKLIKQITNESKIKDLLDNNKIKFYIGFDPTADSLHVGHLIQLITIKRLAKKGHIPIILLGGATASIGDPTDKCDMRKNLSDTDISIFKENIGFQIANIINCKHEIRNNLTSFDGMKYLSFIKDIGIHFTINNMLQAECFKSRIKQDLTFLEMNYMLMQAFDFYQLRKQDNCILQIGGDDQWSNILAGIDLIYKKDKTEVFGMTLPLLISSNGTKMGKTEVGTIWLDSKKTSAFDFYQFWINLPDSDIINCFKQLTFLSIDQIMALKFDTRKNIINNKKLLAFQMTALIHGINKANEIASLDKVAKYENLDMYEV